MTPAPANDLIVSDEQPTRKLRGRMAWAASALALVLAALALYWTQYSIGTTVYRAAFLGLVLTLAFLLYPAWEKSKHRDRVWLVDWLLALIGAAALIYLATHIEEVKTRATRPLEIEVWLGAGLILCVLEATRRTTGWVLPFVTIVFLGYALAGPYMPEPLDHRGYSIARLVGQNYLTLEGVFSTPLDVAATFIILFTIYGAVLAKSGAGTFFIEWSFALFGKTPSASAPGRAAVASGFLLGTVSGSGVATTVTLATLSWPMLKRSGYPANVAGGLLSAAGIGALLSPPTLGAAAFIIAEYLQVSYLDVLVMATIPTLLYYLSCWLMVEADARRLGVKPVKTSDASVWALTKRQGYHFISLGAIAVLLATGMSAFMAVFWSISLGFALSLVDARARLALLPGVEAGAAAIGLAMIFGERLSAAVFLGIAVATVYGGAMWLGARREGLAVDDAALRMSEALIDGAKNVIGVAATCACAGIIVSVITLTGLGLNISGLIVEFGGGSLFLTIVFAALAMWILGTAVPVTASYIIAAVMLVPALRDVGVPEAAAHMFLFYYAVLADVSPPTALAPFAAAAITRGEPFATMMQAWKYCMPAFLVPFMFCLSPDGMGLLMKGDVVTIVWTTLTACVGVAALAAAFGGWIIAKANLSERVVAGAAGLA
ncbi:MAG: TRAP transporter fused permease subunit, partial [Alphaproteobacteria bacterium]|nr:TRAP transporter fused permease subunit [Alphaproteobacteria bacterium]